MLRPGASKGTTVFYKQAVKMLENVLGPPHLK